MGGSSFRSGEAQPASCAALARVGIGLGLGIDIGTGLGIGGFENLWIPT